MKKIMTISTRVDEDLNSRLEAIADVFGCSKSSLLLRIINDNLQSYSKAADMLKTHMREIKHE